MAPPQNAEVENVVKFRLLVPQGWQYISMKVNFGEPNEEAPKLQELVKFVFLVNGQVTIIFVVSVGLSVCLCRVFLSRLWSDFDQTMLYVWL